MNKPAFYADIDFAAGQIIRLAGGEANHAHVLHVRPGDAALALNGKGGCADCVVTNVEKHCIAMRINAAHIVPAPVSRPILALALSKAVRRGFFMEKAAELGCAEVWLWQARNSVGRLNAAVVDGCKKQLAAGGKQSRNPWFPVLRNMQNLAGIIDAAVCADWRVLPYEAQITDDMLTLAELGRPGTTVYVIGPEGGLVENEVNAMRAAGFRLVSLGERVLRCETAATLCLGLHMWAAELARAQKTAPCAKDISAGIP